MNKTVKNYFENGCMRCSLGATPECKVHKWKEELIYLRKLIHQTDLKEACKWGVPIYTYNDINVLSLSALKQYCSIGFFKGSLLKDETKLLIKQGPHSQAARLFKFKNVNEIKFIENDILAYIQEAIEIEKAGLQIAFKKEIVPYPIELVECFEKDPILKTAFEALTPGRQRGYLIHFTQAKQSKTRFSRIEKWTPKILNGEGMHDKYTAKNK